MDLFSHFLWIYALAYYLFPDGVLLGYAFSLKALYLSAILPDLTLIPFMAYTLYWAARGKKEKQIEAQAPEWVFSVFYFSHSYAVLAILVLASLFFATQFLLPLFIAYGLHLTIDLVLHKDRFSCKPFYPFNNKQVKGLTDWYNNYPFYAASSLVLALVYFLLWQYKGLTLAKMVLDVFL